MSAHCHTRSHSLLKTVLGKIGDLYQAYCSIYKTHAMATHHRDAGCPLDRGLDILVEDPEQANIDNESTHSSDATVALGGPEAVGHPKDPVYDNQDRLTAFTREINDLSQRVAAGEGQPAKTLDCKQCELQNLSLAIHQPQPPAPAEPLGEVICSTQTPCVPCRNSPTSQTPYYRIYLFLINMTLPHWRTGSLTWRWQRTSPARAEQGLPRWNHRVWCIDQSQRPSFQINLGITSRIYYDWSPAMQISTHMCHDSWRYCSKIRSPLQCMYISSRQSLEDAISWMMHPQSRYSSRVWRMPIVWPPAYMRRDHRCSTMQYPKSRSLMLCNNWLQPSLHHLQSTWCQMMRTAVSRARNMAT